MALLLTALRRLQTIICRTLALFKVLLRDKASGWLVTESASSKDTLEHLIEAFRKRFEDNEVLKSVRKLFTTKQSAEKSVDEFVIQVVKIAQKIGHNKNDDITRYAMLSGLRSEIATHDPKTTDDVIQKARLVEMAIGPKTSATRPSTYHCHRDGHADIQQ